MSMQNQHEKVAVIGMGKTGLSVVRHLQRIHTYCECFDEANVTLPADLQGVLLHTGDLNAEVLSTFDRVIVSPGINWRHPALLALKAFGVAVHGDLDEFLSHYARTLITITGTNGKTTVTQMLALLLETLDGGCDAGGNIGIPMLDLLQERQPTRVVLELSSFQLERSQPFHPQWAVLLNVKPDHADMHASLEAYRAAKLRMFEQMEDGDAAMLPIDCEWNALADSLSSRGVRVSRFGVVVAGGQDDSRIDAGILCAAGCEEQPDTLFWTRDGVRKSIPCHKLMVRGHHQQQNIAVAAQVAADFSVPDSVIEEAMLSFQGLEHRLEYMGHIMGCDWFNDSKATNPDAALAALASFEQVVWICGGLRKGLALDGLLEVVRKHVAFACVIGEEVDAYVELLERAGVPFIVSHTVENAVLDAHKQGGKTVLLSPSAASQDQFNNYAERGHAFVKAIRALEDDA